jgi:serine O-acetyltransferase
MNDCKEIVNSIEDSEKNGLASVVASLCDHINEVVTTYRRQKFQVPLPSRAKVIEIMEAIRAVIFPGYFGPSELNRGNICFHVGATLDNIQRDLTEQIKRGYCFICGEDVKDSQECDAQARQVSRKFLEELPSIQRLLITDAIAAYEGDPAATSPDEAIFCYPGMLAITNYRLAHVLYRFNVPLIPRIITEHAHSSTGIDIHPGATIGESFFIDHGTGVVIGETSEIGKKVRIYQGVTLGAKSFPLDHEGKPIKGIKRHPIVEDEVIIYSGATILGRVTIGRGAVIGGNVWLTQNVPPGSSITQYGLKRETFEEGSGI